MKWTKTLLLNILGFAHFTQRDGLFQYFSYILSKWVQLQKVWKNYLKLEVGRA